MKIFIPLNYFFQKELHYNHDMEEMSYENFNTMGISEMVAIPGIGKTTAKRIASMRPFKTNNDLFKVRGLGATTLKKLGIEKVKKERRKWYTIEGKEYPQSACARDILTGEITFFWRIPKDRIQYLELEGKESA